MSIFSTGAGGAGTGLEGSAEGAAVGIGAAGSESAYLDGYAAGDASMKLNRLRYY